MDFESLDPELLEKPPEPTRDPAAPSRVRLQPPRVLFPARVRAGKHWVALGETNFGPAWFAGGTQPLVNCAGGCEAPVHISLECNSTPFEIACGHPAAVTSSFLAPCRRCVTCQIARQKMWISRGVDEVAAMWPGQQALFVTGTHDWKKYPALTEMHEFWRHSRRAVTLWAKQIAQQVRRANGLRGGSVMRYLISFEAHPGEKAKDLKPWIGENQGRPHFHALLIFAPGIKVDPYQVKRAWEDREGWADVETPRSIQKVIGYISSYLTADGTNIRGLAKMRPSIGFGRNPNVWGKPDALFLQNWDELQEDYRRWRDAALGGLPPPAAGHHPEPGRGVSGVHDRQDRSCTGLPELPFVFRFPQHRVVKPPAQDGPTVEYDTEPLRSWWLSRPEQTGESDPVGRTQPECSPGDLETPGLPGRGPDHTGLGDQQPSRRQADADHRRKRGGTTWDRIATILSPSETHGR